MSDKKNWMGTKPQVGKGDRPRPTKLKQFRENWDAIDWKKLKKVTTAAKIAFLVSCALATASCSTTSTKPRSTTYRQPTAMLARVTAYWAQGRGTDRNTHHHNGSWIGYRGLREGHCAVDPRRIPYGSQVILPDGEKLDAVDTGGAVKSRKAARLSGHTPEERAAVVVDKFFETRGDAIRWANTHPLFCVVQVILP